MPGLLRRLVVIAAVDGLILQSPGNGLRSNGNNEPSCIRIDYRTSKISFLPTSAVEQNDRDLGLETYGLVGLLSVASSSFLIPITQRHQVAQIHGKPIYTISDVAVIPTSSQADANRAIAQAREHMAQGAVSQDQDETASEEAISDGETDGGDTEIASLPPSPIREPFHSRSRSSINSIAEDVIGKKVRFGRFAANWLSRKTLGLPGLGTVDQDKTDMVAGKNTAQEAAEPRSAVPDRVPDVKEAAGTSAPSNDTRLGAPWSPSSESTGGGELPPSNPSNPMVEFLPKFLRYTRLLFASHNFFFAYDYDLTRHMRSQDSSRTDFLPLHKAVDEMYFWNRHLMVPFITADAHGFVLPLMQGFVGQREFTIATTPEQPSEEATANESVEERSEGRILGEKQEAQGAHTAGQQQDFLLTLISRRSIKRPGLRYLRRGVDDDGNTANSVETEQILSVPDWEPSRKVYSYLQIRGSIPLYFSQSPYAFKPVPVLHHSTETNQLAFERHFRDLSRRYGKIQAVSLIDKQAGELKMGEQYEKYARTMAESGGIDGAFLGLEWFDFHNECRGMKFENVSRLVDRIESALNECGDTVVQNNAVIKHQAGIVRTNCMDCLDRTGVAQCAFGQWALERQLKQEGIDISLGGDSSTQWFNTLWADNGDAISKQYSSTAALKGDYTRTRKRDYRGALNDLGLTLSRYYNNIVNDYFSQACIDYLLGNVSTHVFQEFAMEMKTADPGISVQKLRQNAIDTSCRIVISDPSEDFLGGWTLLTPRQPNTLRTLPFEEAVLLLTDAAIYSCRFDWNTDKVLSFERIDLRAVSRITYGTYITSTLTDAQTDDHSNVGLVIEYRQGDPNNALRVNTRSLRSNVDAKTLDTNAHASDHEWNMYSWFRGLARSTPRFIAFKALPLSNSVTQTKTVGAAATVSETDWVRAICEDIERARTAGERLAVASQPSGSGSGPGDGTEGDSSASTSTSTSPADPTPAPASVIHASEIISLDDAKKRTGYLEHLVYDIKKMVWA